MWTWIKKSDINVFVLQDTLVEIKYFNFLIWHINNS